MTKLCRHAERQEKAEPILCKKIGSICVAQKYCKVTRRMEPNESIKKLCKFYRVS